MKYKDIVYSILDEAKLFSDDSDFTPEHIIYLINKYRIYLLKELWDKRKMQPSDSNYQEICIDLEEVPALDGMPCTGGTYLRSTKKIPTIASVGEVDVYTDDYFQSKIIHVTPEKFRYAGENKFRKNLIFSSIPPNHYLYLRSRNPQYLYLEKVRLKAIFEDPEEALELSCDPQDWCDILDAPIAIDSYLIPQLQEMILKEILGVIYRPSDYVNNGTDDFSQNTDTQQQQKIDSKHENNG